MDTNNMRTCSALAAALFWASASLAAEIHYVADDGGGVYCGVGYGINVNVPPDYDDVTIKYSENAIGPWRDSVLYTNVCMAKSVYFKIEAEGYDTVIDFRTVTITPKTLTSANVWIVLPTDDYVYDGTGKTPDVFFGDRAPAVLTRNDFDVSYASNTNAGTAVATFTGKGNYTGTVEEEFDILKAPFPGDGEEPGDGEVPGDGISKFDTTAIYDGLGHTIDTNALATAFRTVVGDDCVILYSVGEGLTSDLVWEPAIPVYTNAGEYVVFYCVQSENYEDFIHEAKMTITPRDVTLTSGSASKTYDGSPLTAQTVTVGGDGFVAGEGATYDVTGSQTLPGTSTNTFTYTLIAGTLADNYEITTVAGSLTVTPATIHYAADNGGGVYCGVGYGINVNVPPDYDDVTIKYSENAIGPWRDSVLYTNVCNVTPVFFLIEADGYISVTNSRTVTVTPKTLTSANVWIVLPTDDYVYDGTGKTPDVYFGDRAPSVLTRDDFDVSYTSNTNAGTAVATFTGKRNYTGTVEEEFEIGRAPLLIGAETKSKRYGEDDPPLTYTNSALVGTDQITGALAREPGDAVGTYAILQGSLDAGDNYDIDYTGATFTITKAPFPGDGEEPGDGTVPQGGESKFDATSVYDGQGHTIDTNALVAAFGALLGEDFQVSYAADDPNVQVDARQWAPSAPAYTNVGEYTLWYRVTPTNYEDFAHKAKVTITPRPVNVAADPQTKRRGENDPPLTYTADPLIAGDSFSGNLERESGETNGVYAITIGSLTAGDNYEIAFTGASLTISDDVPQLPGATLRWKFAASVGRYFAQVSIPAQAGYSESLGNLAFLFADRKSADGTIYAQLWDLPSRGPCPVVVTDNGVEFRGVALDASAFAGKADGTPVVFGVSDATFAESRDIVPSHERLIGLYVRKRVNPVSGNETDGEVENFIGYLSWTTGGTRYFLPVVEGAANGEVSTQARRSLGRTSSGFSFAVMPHAYEPATLGLSVSLGLNAIAVANDSPKARISAFEVGADGSVRGRVEAIAGGEASSSFGSTATVVVFASETPAGPWREVRGEVDSAIGAFTLPAGTVIGHFFRAEVETNPIFE